jgi:hypothetical protein
MRKKKQCPQRVCESGLLIFDPWTDSLSAFPSVTQAATKIIEISTARFNSVPLKLEAEGLKTISSSGAA